MNIPRISQRKHEKAKTRDKSASARKGFTLIEVLAAVAIIGLMTLIFYPNILNTPHDSNILSEHPEHSGDKKDRGLSPRSPDNFTAG
jgi:prepilin-type N-terminal cleavage/methylation domain-containing protein